jgi:transcriptional regulator with XRE-family HTH domain
MPRTTPTLSAGSARVLQDWGAELKATRQAQGRSAEHVAAAAGITRKTLQRVERGDPAAAFGTYVRVLQTLGLLGVAAAKPVLHEARREQRSSPPTKALPRDHRSLDARSLAMHRRIADKIRAQPALLNRARETIERWEARGAGAASRPYLEAWRRLIDQGLETALAVAVDPGERGNAMRQASPFTGILDNRERWALLRGRGA